MFDSLQLHGLQPVRLLCPWDFPGRNTGVGCHFLLQCMKVKSEVKSLSHVQPSVTPWTAVFQAPLSMGFSRQEYWSGVPLPSPKVYLVSTRSSRSRLNMLNLSRQIILPNILSFVEAFVQFSSVVQSCPTLCNPMDFSMPGFPVHHQLPELTQTYVH